MRLTSRVWLLLGGFGWCLGALVFAASSACGTSASNTGVCSTLEDARCHRAPGCNIDVSDPLHRTGTDVSSCIRYYDTECLHGLETSYNPSQDEINACLQAINQASCDVVETPQNDPRCAWLVPSATDAGADADAAADASDDASDGSDADAS